MRRLPFPTLALVAGAILFAPAARAQSASVGDVTFNLNGRIYGFADAASGQSQTFGALEALRLYPSFDGLTTSGIKFGMYSDLREGADTGPGAIRQGQFYTRRLYAFIGTSTLGTIRIGTTDGASAIYQVGTFDVGPSVFSDGGWNGIAHYNFAAAANPAWPFASSRFYYATNKIVYISPRLSNVDFSLSFEPDIHGANLNTGGHFNADSNSDFVDASNIVGFGAERHDTFDGAVRYAQAFGDLAAIATASYVSSGTAGATYTAPVKYQGLNFGDIGGSVAYAGLTAAADLQYGKFDGVWELSPQGAPNSTAYSVGFSYQLAAYAAGLSYYNYRSPGDVGFTTFGSPDIGGRLEQGISVGSSYIFSKNVTLYADYLYGQRVQSGYDFETAAAGSSANAVHTQGISVGGRVSW